MITKSRTVLVVIIGMFCFCAVISYELGQRSVTVYPITVRRPVRLSHSQSSILRDIGRVCLSNGHIVNCQREKK